MQKAQEIHNRYEKSSSYSSFHKKCFFANFLCSGEVIFLLPSGGEQPAVSNGDCTPVVNIFGCKKFKVMHNKGPIITIILVKYLLK